MSQSLSELIRGKNWTPSPSFNPSVLASVSNIRSMQFMDDGRISFPGIDDLDMGEEMKYEIKDRILILKSGDVETSFGKIINLSDHMMLLNPINEESGEVINGMALLFYSDHPTKLNLHPGYLSDLQAYSRWNIQAYGKSIDLIVGPGGKENDHSSIVKEGDSYFLLIDTMKLKIMTFYHDKMEVLGIGTEGFAAIRLIKD